MRKIKLTSRSTESAFRKPRSSSKLEAITSRSSTSNTLLRRIGSSPSGRFDEGSFSSSGQNVTMTSYESSARGGRRPQSELCIVKSKRADMNEIPELTPEQLSRSISARLRRRLILGQFESGDDITALRRFVGLTQMQFAQAMGISVHTLRNWEQGRRRPDGPAVALLRIAARHPRIIRENIQSAA